MTYSAIPSAIQNATVQNSAVNSQISGDIRRLRQLNQQDIQANWRGYQGNLSAAQAATGWQLWGKLTPDGNNQIVWPKGRKVLWLGQRLLVPHNLQGYYLQGLLLRLGLNWWANAAQVYVNGRLVQEGDLFDNNVRLLLSPAVKIGNAIDILLRLESPGHANGALVRAVCLYELASQAVNPTAEPAFVADEVNVLQEFLNAHAPDQLKSVAAALAKLPWSVLSVTDRASFDRGLVKLRDELKPLGAIPKARQMQLVGHAHLDMAWLWPVRETWQVAERTFRSVLSLQQDFPELTFAHTSPALYAWIEQNRPDLFAQIQAKVKAGSWDVSIGPTWIEPEMNLGNGETIARHLLYGQRYLQQKFGKTGTAAWLPDTFGFNWQLPQLLQQGGVEFFVTQKLRWNDTTKFPYALHQWQAPDGTALTSVHSAPIGEGIDPVKMARYSCDWEQNTGLPTALWLPGVGDHGGGPTRDMLELARRWQQSPFFPRLQFSSAEAYLKSLPQTASLPVWDSELYLEFHRGCYINRGDQKQFNRRCEDTLFEAELFASLRTLFTGTAYPKAELEAAWKKVLFNQFHDILPGTSIPEAFVDANRDWQAALDTAWNTRQQAMQGLIAQVNLPPAPHPQARLVAVFNPLSWPRSELVTVSAQQTQDERACFWQIRDLNGQEIASQPHCWREGGKTYCQIFFRAENIPAIGYRCFWLLPRSSGNPVPPVPSSGFALENTRLRVTVDPATGNLSGLFDKLYRRDLLSASSNQLQAFRDQGQYWDAWNIDPKYAQFPLPASQLTQIFYEDKGSLTTRIRVIRKIGQSTFNQLYVLDQGSEILKIETQVDWRERHVLVKAAFNFNINANFASYEIPCGVIQRPTRPQTEAEKAKWEVSALRWADLSDTASNDSYGISILSDYKQGYDAKPAQIRLSLLRGSEWPDPNSDLGQHQFTYALYPHDRNWKAAQTPRRGYEVNQPLRVLTLDPATLRRVGSASLPPVGNFLSLPSNFMLSAFKPAEDGTNQWILRGYESQGMGTTLNWQNGLGTTLKPMLSPSATRLNLLEQASTEQSGAIQPWQIATYRFTQLS
ncbi:MAG: alpha-mannosidase [Pegethrix bostrychoides GSE-TBD4-15B]|jgi:alpha-mannosidase|uniref:Alpha-mannosidase n=1 Tax=Pegethrix bostrychoides GSE-TBD4-15B TaxID=2839662 RepID=A0A951P8V9_9CYAN|nr:alpha-mannosidase [Pegethrix bostrychoides GSE-TBD4-15B]